MGKVKTVGYGGRDPDDLRKLVVDADVTMVVDVRRYDSGAYLNVYRPDQIWKLFHQDGISHVHYGEFGKPKDMAIDDYVGQVLAGGDQQRILRVLVAACKAFPEASICFLCAEGDVYEKDGKTPRCHRYYVAEALARGLGDGCEVSHI